MTPLAAFQWVSSKVTHPHLITFGMNADDTLVIKLGAMRRVQDEQASNAAITRIYTWSDFGTRFGFEAGKAASGATATATASVPTATATATASVPTAAATDEAIRRIADEVSKGHIAQAGTIFTQYVTDAANKVLNGEALKRMVEAEARKITQPVRVEYKPHNAEAKDCGVQHRSFPDLLRLAGCRTADGMSLNVALVGPAGTGKTTAAKMLGKALNRPVFLYSAMDNKYEFFGYRDANGKPVRTNAREAWEQPSVILFDEVDACTNSAVLGLNGALANGIADFPDGNIVRHPECFAMAGANTWSGATVDYNGREKLDAAFRNRFVKLDWDIDETLEKHFAVSEKWVRLVQAFRSQVASKGIRGVLITPRATIYGDSLLSNGFTLDRTAEIVLKDGFTDTQYRELFRAASVAAGL
jgi:hypothetical protein